MRFLFRFILAALLLCSLTAGAEERVTVCFNYGCFTRAEVIYDEGQLRNLAALLAGAHDAVQEREAISVAIGRMLAWAGQQTPISADRGGNYADDAVHGKMDCIDHSTTTTRLLRLMEKRGWLRYHRVLDRVLRRRFLIFEHYSAQIGETAAMEDDDESGRYVVDTWFFDNGQPAVVLPVAKWQAGETPYVGE